MRIALLSDEYLPSGIRIHSKMIHELAINFKERGHETIVITPGDPYQQSHLIIDFIDEIEIWRFKSGHTRGVGFFRRAMNEWLLSYRAWIAIKQHQKNSEFDLCVNYSPTIFFGPLAGRLKSKGSYVYLVLRDMFPQWIIDQGLIKDRSLPAMFFRYYEKLNYTNSNCIGLQSQANLKVFKKNFPQFHNTQILRNWAADKALASNLEYSAIRERYHLQNKVILFYGGNIGHAQDMRNIMRLARNLKHIDNAHFLIIGQGDEFGLIKELKLEWKLDNVTILPSVTQDEFRNILSTIDIGLFSLSYQHTAHNFPGKLLGYMIQSIPILGSTNPGNDLSDIVNSYQAGQVFVNGEDKLLMEAATKLIFDEEFRKKTGRNANILLQAEFSVDQASSSILKAMSERF